MKIVLIFLFLSLSFSSFAEDKRAKETAQKEKMDYGDKQLLKRNVCRKPIEHLETRYKGISKEKLEKMKSECEY